MPDHYFTAVPESAHEERHFTVEFAGRTLCFETDAGVFSKQHVDPGSMLLCRNLPEALHGDVLDMGCGWGAMTVLTLAAHPDLHMTMADVNTRALALAVRNVETNGMHAEARLSDGFGDIDGLFDAIITNPPVRAGKAVIYSMFKDAASHLKPGGALVLVMRKQQGAPSTLQYLQTLYARTRVIRRDGGYWVIECREAKLSENEKREVEPMETFDSAYFDAGIKRTGTDSLKWDGMLEETGDHDMLPMWVADMDFPSPPAVQDALAQVLARGTWGYTLYGKADVDALCGYWQRHHHVQIDPSWVLASPCVVTGLKLSVRATAKPGEGVMIFPPVYGPFFESIKENGREIIESPLTADESGRYSMDFADIETKLASGRVKAVMLCSPHNPCGRVWTRDELQTLARLCKEYGAIIISDEIHADFVYAPHEHVSIMCIDEAAGNRVMLCAASKTFNVAGLEQSAIVCDNDSVRQAIARDIEASGVKAGNAFALAATRAAYTRSDAWLNGLKTYLVKNRDTVMAFAAERLPRVRVTPLEATYLMWFDCRMLGLEQDELLARIAKEHVKVNDGLFFGELGRGFIRLNIGCPRPQLLEALERIAKALE